VILALLLSCVGILLAAWVGVWLGHLFEHRPRKPFRKGDAPTLRERVARVLRRPALALARQQNSRKLRHLTGQLSMISPGVHDGRAFRGSACAG
jgi:hypothetical protein